MPKHHIRFDEESHAYWVDGAPTISVTNAIASSGLYGSDVSFWDERSREFGTAVHKAMALYLEGMGDPADPNDWGLLDIEQTHPRVIPRVASGKAFMARTKLRPVNIEARVCYHQSVAGTLDMLAVDPSERYSIIDWKAGQHIPAYSIQTAGYELCLLHSAGIQVAARCSVSLLEKRPNCHWHNNPRDRDTFLYAVAIAQWKADNKVN